MVPTWNSLKDLRTDRYQKRGSPEQSRTMKLSPIIFLIFFSWVWKPIHQQKSRQKQSSGAWCLFPYRWPLVSFTSNARICGWFGAQRKTSPTTCACYARLFSAVVRKTNIDAVIYSMYETRWFGTIVGLVPCPWPLNLFRPVGMLLSSMLRNELNCCCQNNGTRPLSKHICINALDVAFGWYAQFLLSHIAFIVL